jgi:hypothetical protein
MSPSAWRRPATLRVFGPDARHPPYPDLTVFHRRAIEDALVLAWANVCAPDSALEVANAKEVDITYALSDGLNELLEHPSPDMPAFSRKHFETVVTGGEVADFAGAKVQKKPDLVFRPKGELPGAAQYYGLFVEAKIVDATHSIRDYCDLGVKRFVDGVYAWAMNSALMVAYVRGDYAMRHLEEFLGDHSEDYLLRRPPVLAKSPLWHSAPIECSTHGRPWKYPVTGGLPGDIVLGHLWLSAVAAAS